jgi:hypothetical protein
MLAFDLSSTPLARSDELGLVPTDSELCAIVNALLSVKRSSIAELDDRGLTLCADDLDRIQQAIVAHASRTHAMTSGASEQLRERA